MLVPTPAAIIVIRIIVFSLHSFVFCHVIMSQAVCRDDTFPAGYTDVIPKKTKPLPAPNFKASKKAPLTAIFADDKYRIHLEDSVRTPVRTNRCKCIRLKESA